MAKAKLVVDARSVDNLVRVLGTFDENINFLSEELGVFCYVEGVKIRIEGEKLFISGKDGKWAEVPLENNNVYHGQRYWGSGHSVLIEDYYYCLRSGEKFEIDALEGGRAAQIVACCYVSSESGESVTTD